MKQLQYFGLNAGHCQVNFSVINPQGQRIFYCFVEKVPNILPNNTFHLYRCCKNFEPQGRAHNKIPLKELVNVASIPESHQLLRRLRLFIQRGK